MPKGADYKANAAKGLAKSPKFTTAAGPEFLYGTEPEVAGRLEGRGDNTESSFTQIKPSRRSPRGGSIAERAPGMARNGHMGKSEHHSGV